ncbi:hypothetical protein E2C01_029446 [Portunus trituberculatus]|uniref:Uncharacterized protein n=1 Tax=Portunus trituberculatus TaxID=210409 RepID=A0A5B7EPD6_PORTR|nr:hypothetical protein [Portunus trituberculatus]
MRDRRRFGSASSHLKHSPAAVFTRFTSSGVNGYAYSYPPRFRPSGPTGIDSGCQTLCAEYKGEVDQVPREVLMGGYRGC